MQDLSGVIRNTVPISRFNRGLAGKIFEEVKESGAKVVIKNNTAECVLLSPAEYVRIMDELNEAKLLSEAVKRMESFDRFSLVSSDELYHELGISAEDIADSDEVEIE